MITQSDPATLTQDLTNHPPTSAATALTCFVIIGMRPEIVGNDAGPEPPFPLKLDGTVIKGFGRGSKEVGDSLHLTHPL